MDEQRQGDPINIYVDKIIRNRYRLEKVLGHGSMGTTYKAKDLKTQRPVAVKLLHFSRVSEWKVLEMFEREARILQKLSHARIPTYIDYFSLESESDTQFLLVQEYIDGKTLEQMVEEGWRGNEKEILAIFWQLIMILGFLHTLQPPVIHRDINPKNIILSPNQEVYLVDFGAVQERIRTTFLGGSTIVGTYGYVPFEQFSGQTVPASDYYAVGATLLYMLTHRHPSDFPTEKLKPAFHSTLRASPNITRLLDGLFEADVSKRIASPKAVKKILKKMPKISKIPELKAERFQPSKTNIQKIVDTEAHLYFHIPKRKIAQGIKRVIGGAVLVGITFPAIFVGGIGALFGFIGLGLLASGLDCLFGKTILELTPEWVQIRRKCFRFEYGSSKRLPTASIQKSDISGYFEKSRTSRWKKPRSVLGINHAGRSLELGAKFTQRELEWLIQEINEYVSKYAKALPKNHEK